MIFTLGPKLKGGSKRTGEFAKNHVKPCLRVWPELPAEVATWSLRTFIEEHRISVLNVAGFRGSKEPEVLRGC